MIKKLIITIIFLMVCSSETAYSLLDDGDKKLHFVASFVSAAGATMLMDAYWPEVKGWKKFACVTAIAMVPGIIKEAADSRSGGSGWDNEDLLADLAGASAGSVTILTITWSW